MTTTTKDQPKQKRLIKPVPLALGYALGKIKPLHKLLPDRVLYRLPLSWNMEMLQSFLRHGKKRVYIDIHTRLNMPTSFAPRVETKPEHRLSESQVRSFWDNGFLGPFDLCTPEEMKAKEKHMWSLWDRGSRTYPPGTYEFAGDKAASTDKSEMSNEEYATKGLNARDKHLDDPQLLDVYTDPKIVERVAQLLGPDLLLWRTQFFPKYAGMGGTGWHQASSYLNETMRVATLYPPELDELFQLTVWIACTDSTKQNGCLRMVKGTHREIQPMTIEEYDPKKHENNKLDRFGTQVLRTHDPIDDKNVVEHEMKAGQFIIFSERVMHGALPNITKDNARLGMSGRYIMPSVRVHNPWVLGDGGLDIAYLKIKSLRLDRWYAIQVRGQDRFKVNKRVRSVEEARALAAAHASLGAQAFAPAPLAATP